MKLTILMYHKIAEPLTETRHPGNYVTPAQFEQQLDALLTWGYRSIGFDDWLAYRDGRGRLPAKPLIVTFDDGYRCFDTTAWPMLRSRGMRATVFLVAGQIGGTNAWDADESQEALLAADRIVELQRDGVEFGSHGNSHVALAKVPPPVALDELTRSRRALEELLGRPVTLLAYPYSNQNQSVRDLARRVGYRACVRGKGRMNLRRTDPYALRRIKFDLATTISDARRILLRARWLALD